MKTFFNELSSQVRIFQFLKEKKFNLNKMFFDVFLILRLLILDTLIFEFKTKGFLVPIIF